MIDIFKTLYEIVCTENFEDYAEAMEEKAVKAEVDEGISKERFYKKIEKEISNFEEYLSNDKSYVLIWHYTKHKSMFDDTPYNIIPKGYSDPKSNIYRYEVEQLRRAIDVILGYKDVESSNKMPLASYSSKQYAAICYYTSYKYKQAGDYDVDIVKQFYEEMQVAHAEITFIKNFNNFKSSVLKSNKSVIPIIKAILPYFKNDINSYNDIKEELEGIVDDVDKKANKIKES